MNLKEFRRYYVQRIIDKLAVNFETGATIDKKIAKIKFCPKQNWSTDMSLAWTLLEEVKREHNVEVSISYEYEEWEHMYAWTCYITRLRDGDGKVSATSFRATGAVFGKTAQFAICKAYIKWMVEPLDDKDVE